MICYTGRRESYTGTAIIAGQKSRVFGRNVTEFHTPRNRDAWPTIQGYVYQVELSIVRWLDLLPGEELELECGEDIDKISETITADGEEQDRLLEQVKHLGSVSVTFRSSQVL